MGLLFLRKASQDAPGVVWLVPHGGSSFSEVPAPTSGVTGIVTSYMRLAQTLLCQSTRHRRRLFAVDASCPTRQTGLTSAESSRLNEFWVQIGKKHPQEGGQWLKAPAKGLAPLPRPGLHHAGPLVPGPLVPTACPAACPATARAASPERRPPCLEPNPGLCPPMQRACPRNRTGGPPAAPTGQASSWGL